MANQGNVQVPPDSTGKKVDAASLDDAASSVYRQKLVVTGASGTAEVVAVMATAPVGTEMGLVVRNAGTQSAIVSGAVSILGAVPISGTALIAGAISLAAGTNVIGTLNNISATVTVAGNVTLATTPSVVLAAGTGNFGTLNDISRTVQVAIGTPFTLNNISATVTTAGNLNISGSVVIAGSVNIWTTAENQSASRGPRMVAVSTSANATLIAAPGAGLSIFVTRLTVSNASGSNTKARCGSSATPGNVTMMMAASGGGFTMDFTPPWQISANEACLASIKPNASEALYNVHFFVGSADAF